MQKNAQIVSQIHLWQKRWQQDKSVDKGTLQKAFN